MAVFLVQQIQRERLWHVVVFLWIASEIFSTSSSKKSSDFSGMLELVGMSSVWGGGIQTMKLHVKPCGGQAEVKS